MYGKTSSAGVSRLNFAWGYGGMRPTRNICFSNSDTTPCIPPCMLLQPQVSPSLICAHRYWKCGCDASLYPFCTNSACSARLLAQSQPIAAALQCPSRRCSLSSLLAFHCVTVSCVFPGSLHHLGAMYRFRMAATMAGALQPTIRRRHGFLHAEMS